MRRPLKKKPEILPDGVYESEKVTKLINYIMKDGKKSVARKVVYDALAEIKKDGDPIEVLETAIRNVGPAMEVRSRRVGGANYQVPREVRAERRLALAFRWIVQAAGAHKGQAMYKSLAAELKAAAANEGEAVRKRENTHKMAEANKAFAHFAW
ncbi:30S ribosomal protein S7 [Candidatus Kaiserbacteria bacterium CG10_big_fil_rev_8_21_14_0_10_49_17]|uniref:Small ribosomal subunit protein uS7 n=1 Tax=Candidatus Kaiserbacteria bacterium CG10_big_fil_rev_8_21_14_0_10_49_17 TaxID=1974609 RepID=A0A2M6WEL0_9BACT|nr:MAG: 30S ribosomal protein S7 [Candidatus Kaiserbacteria bacterium CG10_big_fil_rev_8_21_14_0_10_49_17]